MTKHSLSPVPYIRIIYAPTERFSSPAYLIQAQRHEHTSPSDYSTEHQPNTLIQQVAHAFIINNINAFSGEVCSQYSFFFFIFLKTTCGRTVKDRTAHVSTPLLTYSWTPHKHTCVHMEAWMPIGCPFFCFCCEKKESSMQW